MATKDFKVKHGLHVKESLLVDSNISFAGQIVSLNNGTEVPVISSEGKYLQFVQDLTDALLSITTDDISEGDSNLYYTFDKVNNDILSIIDSDYINSRVIIPDTGIDSSSVTSIIDSSYINARVVIPEAGIDSSSVTSIIDSDYVSSRIGTDVLGEGNITSYFFNADSGQTIFSGVDGNGLTLSYNPGNLQVFVNGVLLVNEEDYSAIDGTSILFIDPVDFADQVVVNSFSTYFTSLSSNYVYSGEIYFKSYSYIADSGQTIFSGSDADGNTLSFDSNNYQIYLNGIKIGPEDFIADPINDTITFLTAELLNDEITITVIENDPLSTEVKDILSSQISSAVDSYAALILDSDIIISIVDSNYINSRVVIPPAYSDSDVRLLIDSNYINNKLTRWQEATSNINAVVGQKLILDTNNIITVTLPSVANLGDEIKIIDGTGNASINNITIDRNGHKIQGDDSDLIVDINRAAFGLVYYNESNGWIFTEV